MAPTQPLTQVQTQTALAAMFPAYVETKDKYTQPQFHIHLFLEYNRKQLWLQPHLLLYYPLFMPLLWINQTADAPELLVGHSS